MVLTWFELFEIRLIRTEGGNLIYIVTLCHLAVGGGYGGFPSPFHPVHLGCFIRCSERRCGGWRWKRKLMRPKEESSWLSLNKRQICHTGKWVRTCVISYQISLGADCMIYAWLYNLDACWKDHCTRRCFSTDVYDILYIVGQLSTWSSKGKGANKRISITFLVDPSPPPKHPRMNSSKRKCISSLYILNYYLATLQQKV